ncbi:arginase family protein [Allosaccharopolyspora coralli]|uniref:Arginase family protein n=1 Tax=Allosaccharopolyspora coralli TaxID=2665642 RepID=A0A5Q3Q3N7_9PSEU|nr:arginase family protein [Allosaccharopolyspora coralli]QGK68440.1 arginase family protein [Allosaccharopolyspora coralli]
MSALTVFRGRAGDRNERAMRGAVQLGEALARRTRLEPAYVSTPEPPLGHDWEPELSAARPGLRDMAETYERLLDAGTVPVTVLTRCAVALATVPVVARHHPEACVVWLDAHGDLNTPDTTGGYLGGMALSGAAGLWDSGLGGDLATGNIVLAGARDLDPAEQRLLDDGVIRAVELRPDFSSDLRAAVGQRPVYVHLDCDVLEPGIVPTEYRVPGGLDLATLRSVAEVLAEQPIVGVEIAEFEGSSEHRDAADALIDALDPLLQKRRVSLFGGYRH